MPGQRKAGQAVDAFSAPESLLRAAAAEALRRGMTKTGFYRYCIAKECGYSEKEAQALATHRSVTIAREKLVGRASGDYPAHRPQMNEPNSTADDPTQSVVDDVASMAERGAPELRRKPRVGDHNRKT